MGIKTAPPSPPFPVPRYALLGGLFGDEMEMYYTRYCCSTRPVKTEGMKPDGNFDQQAFLDYVRHHPEVAPLVARQYEAGRIALGNLAIFLAAFLPPLVQHFHTGVR